MTFESKRNIVDKIYPPGSIEFFPKWYLNADNARAQNPMLLQDEWPKKTRPSSIEMKKGILICFGVIDVDFYWARKEPRSLKSNGKVESVRFG